MKLFTKTMPTWILNITFDVRYDSSFYLAYKHKVVKVTVAQRYTYRVLQTIQMKVILLWVWA